MFDKALKFGIAGCLACLLAPAVNARTADTIPAVALASLPAAAASTYELIKRGGPFPYAKDGVVFGNYEHQLPSKPRGYYHEYTVPTPHARSRGARRIIVGGVPPDHADYFYTGDHYVSFQRIQAN
ncbi:MAG: ribonuclease [Pseudomonadota bacterium]|nr:ribonuclease [Pseudomonadota bacterium]